MQAPARAEDLFRECYQMGEVRAKTSKFWQSQLAHGKRYITAIHIEVGPRVLFNFTHFLHWSVFDPSSTPNP